MHKRRLGQDGPLVSAIGVGAMSFSDFYGPTTREESLAILDAALELGIDHIDTANVYGMGVSESAIGEFLANRDGQNPFTIATKAAITRHAETNERYFNNSAEHLEAELDKSLTRMGLERVDLFYVHRRARDIEIEEVTESLVGLIKKGKIASFGYSEIAPSSLRRAAKIHPVAAVQSEYSLATRTPEIGLVQTCAELGTALVAFSPVSRGLLTDNPPNHDTHAASQFMSSAPRFQGVNLTENLAFVERFRALAADFGLPAAGLAIAWLLHRGEHVIPIPGTRSVDHLRELAAGTERKLSADELAQIDGVLPIGWANGDRYSDAQWVGPERYA